MGLTEIFIYSVYIALFIGSLYRPIFGVMGYLAVYMTYDPDIWWGITFQQYLPRPSIVAMSFLLLGSLIHIKKLKWSFSRREIELYLFLGSVWLSSLVFGAGIAPDNWVYLDKITKIFIFIFFFIRVVNSENKYKLIMWTFVLGAMFLAVQAHTVSSGYFYRGRLESLGGIDFRESNGIAAFLALAMTFLGIQMLHAPWWKKMVYVFGIALLLNAIIMTQSRAIFLGIVIAACFVMLWPPKGLRTRVYIFLILGILLFFTLSGTKFYDRMQTIEDTIATKQGEALKRLDFWKASVLIFMDYPLGVGVKNFEKIVSFYDPNIKDRDAHNTYVLCYSEIGILGIFLFLIILGEAWLQLRRVDKIRMDKGQGRKKSLDVFALRIVYLIYLLGYMMTHSILYTEILWILLSMPICLENAVQKLLIMKTERRIKYTDRHMINGSVE